MDAKDVVRRETNKAIRIGKLVRPSSCEKCKRVGLTHAHHSDYSKPLSVMWLCPICHAAQDKIDGMLKRGRKPESQSKRLAYEIGKGLNTGK